MRIRTAFLVVTVAVPAAAYPQAVPSAARVARVADSLARAFVLAGSTPSVAFAVVRGTDTIAMAAWGVADLEQEVPARANSVYRIGSVTKQFTAAAVMQLVEQNKVKLDDSIATYLTTLPVAWHKVTVRQLLNHTSGIPSYTDIGMPWVRRWGEEMTPDTLIALTAREPMWFPAGTKWQYDNTGYVVLGMLIEKIAGRPWGTDMAERFFKPLGLTQTYDCQNTALISHRVRGYTKQGGKWVNAPYLAMSQPYAAGALCSTIEDISRWNRALHSGQVVSRESYALMTTPEGAAMKGELRYGFGLGADTIAGRPVITHGGGIHGFTSANVWVPSAQLSVTVLTNAGSAHPDELSSQLIRAALGVELAQPPKLVALAATDRGKYVGVYALQLPNGVRDLTIAEQGGQLTAQIAGQAANKLLHYGNNTFGVDFDPALRFIFTVTGNRSTTVTLLQGGGSFNGSRKP